MKILDEIMVNFDLDCKILNDTPAKLKLRDKTLKGICFNLNDEEGIIPTMMLAKKNDEDDENIVEESVVTNELADINAKSPVDVAIADSKFNSSGKLRVSLEKEEILKNVSHEMMELVVDEEEIHTGEMPIVDAVDVEEIKETEENNEEISIEPVEMPIDEAQYNVEQGEDAVIEAVETVDVPIIETVSENTIPNVEEEVTNEVNALEKANSDDDFKETSSLKQEIEELKMKEQASIDLLNKTRENYQNEVNYGIELDKTYAKRQQEAKELEQQFHEAMKKQKNILSELKKGVEERNNLNEQEIEEFNNKMAEVKEQNAIKLEKIQEEDDKIVQFKDLIMSVQNLEGSNNFEYPEMGNYESESNYEEEAAYKKVA